MAYTWAVALGTTLATLSGAKAAPPDQRTVAARLVVAAVLGLAAIGLVADVVGQTFSATDIYDIMGSVLGGGIALRGMRRTSALTIQNS